MVVIIFMLFVLVLAMIVSKGKNSDNNSVQTFTKKNYKEIKRIELLNVEHNLFDKAVDLKRNGKYEEADRIYTELMNRYGASCVLYVAMAKNLASAQDYNNAITLLKNVIKTLGENQIKTKNDLEKVMMLNRGNINQEACSILWNSLDHLESIEAIKSNRFSDDEKLKYLRGVSGNPRYQIN